MPAVDLLMSSTVTMPPASAGTADITVEKHAITMAPAQIWPEVTNIQGLAAFVDSGTAYQGEDHEYEYDWTINGQPLADFAKFNNMVDGWEDANSYNGRKIGIVLPDIGDYVLSCTVTDRAGVEASAVSETITVTDPLDFYNEDRRIYVDLDGVYPGKPAASVGVSSLDALETELLTGGTPRMVLFERGETYDLSTKVNGTLGKGQIVLNTSRPIGYVGAYGAGTVRPILKPSCAIGDGNRDIFRVDGNVWNTADGPANVIFNGLDVQAEFDPVNETGYSGGAAFYVAGNNGDGTYVTVYDCASKGMDKVVQNPSGVVRDLRCAVVNNDFQEARDYGIIWGQDGGHIAIVGNRLTHNPNSARGGDKGDTLVATHTPLRIQRADYAYITKNDIFSTTGWSPVGGNVPRQIQSPIRLFAAQKAGQAAYIGQNCLEGGWRVINSENAVSGFPVGTPGNIVIERNLMLMTAETQGVALSSSRSGITFRGNYMYQPNVVQVEAGASSEAVKFAPGGTGDPEDPNNLTNPIRIYSNTLFNDLTAANDLDGLFAPFVNRNGHFGNFVEENNAWHKPNADNPYSIAPVDTATDLVGIDPEYLGYRYGYDLITDAIPAGGWLDNGTITIPYTSILQRLQDGSTLGDNTTDQAYWQANGGTAHALYVYTVVQKMFATKGHFTVSFDATEVTLTNTSGVTIGSGGEQVRIHLDRSSVIPAMSVGTASPATVPILVPDVGSTAYQTATSGLTIKDDFYNVPMPAPQNAGAFA